MIIYHLPPLNWHLTWRWLWGTSKGQRIKPRAEKPTDTESSWCFQPIWKKYARHSSHWMISPRIGVKIKHIWNHHLVNLQTFWNLVKKIHPEINRTTWTWYPKLGNPCTYKTLQNSNFGVPSQKLLGCSTKNIQSQLHNSSTTGWRRLRYDLSKCLWKIYSRQTPTDTDDIRYSMSWKNWNN